MNIWNRNTGQFVNGAGSNDNNPTYMVFSTTTSNGLSHSAFWSWFATGQGLYRHYNHGLPEDLFFSHQNLNYVYNPPINISSSGNDVHIVWKDNLGSNNGNNLRYIYDDQPPTAPKNLTITKSSNNHPLLSWSENPEPDLIHYKIYRLNQCSGGWNPINTATGLTYEDQTLSYCTLPPPQQCSNQCIYQYRITAIDNADNGSLESSPSNTVSVALVGGGPPQKIGLENTSEIEYNLARNYPNPFNPSTTISYSIKFGGMASLKVYDMLGTEVASIVNETKEPGNYSVVFDGSNLPSGMYVYQLITDNFMDSKKLILMK